MYPYGHMSGRYRLKQLRSFILGFFAGILLYTIFFYKPGRCVTESAAESARKSSAKLVESFEHSNESGGDKNSSRFDNPRILCWIMGKPDYLEKRTKHVLATWWDRCDIRVITSSKEDKKFGTVVLPNIYEGHSYLYTKTMEAHKYLWDKYKHEADWFLKADDDAFVVVENLRAFLKGKNPADPVWHGSRMARYADGKRQYFMSGGAGYVLSNEATRRYVEGLKAGKGACDSRISFEDVRISECLKQVGVRPGDDRDSELWEVFHGGDVNKYTSPMLYEHSFIDHYYPVCRDIRCTTRWPVTFHHVSPRKIYGLEYLFYKAEVKGRCVNGYIKNFHETKNDLIHGR